MILDALLTFTGTGNGASAGITAGQWTDAPTTGAQDSSNVIDLGVVLGIPSYANGGGARDIAIGYPLWLSALVTETFVDGTSLQIALQGAPDDGTGIPGSYTTMWDMPAVVVEADLVAGVQLVNVMVPRPRPDQPLPRFLKLVFTSAGTHTAGEIEAQIILDRDNQVLGTDDVYSGYPAGLNVAN